MVSAADYADIVARFLHVYQPELLRHSLDELATACEWTTRNLGTNQHWHEEIKAEFGRPFSDGRPIDLQVQGVRAWYRAVLMGSDSLPLKDFTTWDAEQGRLAAGSITFTTTDAELARWADAEEAHAARHGWRLRGTASAAAGHRELLRAQEWDRLAVVGADIAWLEEEPAPDTDLLESRVAERRRLTAAAISWGRGDR